MKWNKIYNYPACNRTTINGSRYYKIDNHKLPSVTEILKATESEQKKKSLLQWRKRVGEEEAIRILKTSSSRGTKMHKYIEEYLVGQIKLNIEDESESLTMANIIINKGLCKLEELWGVEATLSYPGLFAGTVDACGIYNGQQSIIDFKQSNKLKKREWIDDYFLQVSAYALAHNKSYHTDITQGVILICTAFPDLSFQEFTIDNHDFKEYQNRFMGKVEKYNKYIYGDK